jgi:hypothetical protein
MVTVVGCQQFYGVVAKAMGDGVINTISIDAPSSGLCGFKKNSV